MIHINIEAAVLHSACDAHFQAILSFVKGKDHAYQSKLYTSVTNVLPWNESFSDCLAKDDWLWLRNFILADVNTLHHLAKQEDLLQFTEFKQLYSSRFSNGAGQYIDANSKYNAYTFLQNLGIAVCPYCDEEYLDILTKPNSNPVLTLEIDHFYPKKSYPGLALCFFNLIPSCQSCNGLKKTQLLGMNPHESNIEACTYLYPDLPVGINMATVKIENCKINFHPTGAMQQNVDSLLLEQRYEKHKATAHRYLTIMQAYPPSKVEAMVRDGYFPSVEYAYKILYGEPLQEEEEPQLLTKLKRDITGR